MIDQQHGKATLELQSRKCRYHFRKLPLLQLRIEVRTVHVASGAQSDKHGLRPRAPRDRKTDIVKHDAMPDNVGCFGTEAAIARPFLRCVGSVNLKRLGLACKGRQ